VKVYYFGSWGRPGLFLYAPGGRQPRDHAAECYGRDRTHIDGTLAPRRMRRTKEILWTGRGNTHNERERNRYDSEELPQGQFLLHLLDTGFSAIQWWDRNQGDARGACNSTLLLEGRHAAEEMTAALREHFPHVLTNLEKAGVALADVTHLLARAEGL
jgi:hypothetical protein